MIEYTVEASPSCFRMPEGVDVIEAETYIRTLAHQYAAELKKQIDARVEEMKSDDKGHYLMYQVLGITNKEGELIDVYQNKGRFLYKYAGSFLEEAATYCFQRKFPDALPKLRVENTFGKKPKTFEVDCLVVTDAYELKWRDATTDGDHITKEHTRLQVVRSRGYKPIRLMSYHPNRDQAKRIQAALKTLYAGVGGEYYTCGDAWAKLAETTGLDLKRILEKIAQENVHGRN